MNNKGQWKSKYNQLAVYAEKEHELILGRVAPILEHKFLLEESLILKNKEKKSLRILDVGCGPGIFTKFLYKRGYRNIQGVDFSDNMVKRARRESKNKKIDYQVAEITNLPFSDRFFDIVLCFGVFQYLNSKEDQKHALSEIERVLKKDGLLFFSTLNSLSLGILFSKIMKTRNSNLGLLITRYNPFELLKLFKKYGFLTNIKGIYGNFLSGSLLKLIYKCKIHWLLNKFFVIASCFSHSFFVKAKKK